MPTLVELTQPVLHQVLLYGNKLLQGIRAEDFARKPRVQGTTIEINHPAFHFGHLGLYPGRIAGLFNLPAEGLVAPEGWMDLFKIGSPCHDDPEGTIYPKMDKIVSHFTSSHENLIRILPTIPEEKLLAVSTDERSKERFPIVGSFVMYLLSAHPNTHFGQVSAWRRCMGLGPV